MCLCLRQKKQHIKHSKLPKGLVHEMAERGWISFHQIGSTWCISCLALSFSWADRLSTSISIAFFLLVLKTNKTLAQKIFCPLKITSWTESDLSERSFMNKSIDWIMFSLWVHVMSEPFLCLFFKFLRRKGHKTQKNVTRNTNIYEAEKSWNLQKYNCSANTTYKKLKLCSQCKLHLLNYHSDFTENRKRCKLFGAFSMWSTKICPKDIQVTFSTHWNITTWKNYSINFVSMDFTGQL